MPPITTGRMEKEIDCPLILEDFSPQKEAKVYELSSEVRSLTEELKNRAGGGDEIKKINRPISLGKEGFPQRIERCR